MLGMVKLEDGAGAGAGVTGAGGGGEALGGGGDAGTPAGMGDNC